MSDLSDLYQEVILDHYKKPRNFRVLDGADHSAEGYNPLCGDRLTVFVKLNGDVIEDVSFQGSGCAISQASASVMTTAVRGKTLDELRALFRQFRDLVTGDGSDSMEEFGELAAMSGVRAFPTRVKCATLGWHALLAAIDESKKSVSTE